jgi:hypothetical protein
MVLITIVTGAYKPTYNWGASHCSKSMGRVYGFGLTKALLHVTNAAQEVPIRQASAPRVLLLEGRIGALKV